MELQKVMRLWPPGALPRGQRDSLDLPTKFSDEMEEAKKKVYERGN